MPAYYIAGQPWEPYVSRVLYALCKAAGGELRVRGELVDTAADIAKISVSWDSATQEVVLRSGKESFQTVVTINPPKESRQTELPLQPMPGEPEPPVVHKAATRHRNLMDDPEHLAKLEDAIARQRRLVAMRNRGTVA